MLKDYCIIGDQATSHSFGFDTSQWTPSYEKEAMQQENCVGCYADGEIQKARIIEAYGSTNYSAELFDSLKIPSAGNVPTVSNDSAKEMDNYIRSLIHSCGLEEAFYVMDYGCLLRLFQNWKSALPRVEPFYAVKCNPHANIISTLAALGAGFDCASRAEISQILKSGVPPEKIVFANPCKLPGHIAHAASVGVHLTTFDSIEEILKVKRLNPEAKLLIRIRADDAGARCPLGVKYGALEFEVMPLLRMAKSLGVDVVGVSFHVGSGATDPLAFSNAISAARRIFDSAREHLSISMSILDIGGGFTAGPLFQTTSKRINEALDLWFPESCGVRIIAEPGRYFAESCFTLVTSVFGRRIRGKHREYWVDDGIYGSMNCVLYDHAALSARPLILQQEQQQSAYGYDVSHGTEPICYPSTVFGPTCDGLDTVLSDVALPELSVGDRLVFPSMGAYTLAAGSSFNGFLFERLKIFTVCSLLGTGSSGAAPIGASLFKGNDIDRSNVTGADCFGGSFADATNSEGSVILDDLDATMD